MRAAECVICRPGRPKTSSTRLTTDYVQNSSKNKKLPTSMDGLCDDVLESIRQQCIDSRARLRLSQSCRRWRQICAPSLVADRLELLLLTRCLPRRCVVNGCGESLPYNLRLKTSSGQMHTLAGLPYCQQHLFAFADMLSYGESLYMDGSVMLCLR